MSSLDLSRNPAAKLICMEGCKALASLMKQHPARNRYYLFIHARLQSKQNHIPKPFVCNDL